MSSPLDLVPIEWPAPWEAKHVALLRESPFNAIVSDKPLPAGVAEAARAAGLATPDIEWHPWKEARFQAGTVAGVSEAFWPAYSYKGLADGSAGPTGEPWLDANGWLYLYARSRSGTAPFWLRSEAPKETRNVRLAHLQLLLVEALAYGGRHTMWLPPEFATALADSNERAVGDWKKLAATVAWIAKRESWRSWHAVAPMLLVSDFSADNEYIAGETMLLAARQRVAFWPVHTAALNEMTLRNRRSVLYLDANVPGAKTLATLRTFVENGGLLIAGPTLAKSFTPAQPVAGAAHPRFDLFRYGRGQLALSRAAFDEPWALADDAHLLTSRRYDPVRLFNGGLLHTHCEADPTAPRSIVHVVNYGTEPQGHLVIVRLNRPIASARFHVLGSDEVKSAKITGTTAHPEIVLPYFSVYVAIELEHAHA